ncbi:MAG: hypothetical protein L3J26_13415 [Candidatus Polarisedimenticolaceae bacterium]|nr:hypothetical protein [Candidatus Polarisedimenticolaceae bacterium]
MTTPIIPHNWTAREALAVYEFIDTIRDEIWRRYDVQLVELLSTEHSTNPEDWASSVVNEDLDEITF